MVKLAFELPSRSGGLKTVTTLEKINDRIPVAIHRNQVEFGRTAKDRPDHVEVIIRHGQLVGKSTIRIGNVKAKVSIAE